MPKHTVHNPVLRYEKWWEHVTKEVRQFRRWKKLQIDKVRLSDSGFTGTIGVQRTFTNPIGI